MRTSSIPRKSAYGQPCRANPSTITDRQHGPRLEADRCSSVLTIDNRPTRSSTTSSRPRQSRSRLQSMSPSLSYVRFRPAWHERSPRSAMHSSRQSSSSQSIRPCVHHCRPHPHDSCSNGRTGSGSNRESTQSTAPSSSSSVPFPRIAARCKAERRSRADPRSRQGSSGCCLPHRRELSWMPTARWYWGAVGIVAVGELDI